MSALHAMDRREFIGSAGTLVIAATLPAIAPLASAEPAPAQTSGEWVADWTIDDMWGVYPRPAQAIGFGRPRAHTPALAVIDTQFG